MASLKQRFLAAGLVVGATGLATIRNHEGTFLPVYKDPVGILTVCTGHTGPELNLGQVYTLPMCEDLLRKDTRIAQSAVQRLVKVPVTQVQFDALTSFVFNVGEGNFASSTLLRRLNSGDCLGAGAEFPRWNKAKGKVLPGLIKRRADERVLWESGC